LISLFYCSAAYTHRFFYFIFLIVHSIIVCCWISVIFLLSKTSRLIFFLDIIVHSSSCGVGGKRGADFIFFQRSLGFDFDFFFFTFLLKFVWFDISTQWLRNFLLIFFCTAEEESDMATCKTLFWSYHLGIFLVL